MLQAALRRFCQFYFFEFDSLVAVRVRLCFRFLNCLPWPLEVALGVVDCRFCLPVDAQVDFELWHVQTFTLGYIICLGRAKARPF